MSDEVTLREFLEQRFDFVDQEIADLKQDTKIVLKIMRRVFAHMIPSVPGLMALRPYVVRSHQL